MVCLSPDMCCGVCVAGAQGAWAIRGRDSFEHGPRSKSVKCIELLLRCSFPRAACMNALVRGCARAIALSAAAPAHEHQIRMLRQFPLCWLGHAQRLGQKSTPRAWLHLSAPRPCSSAVADSRGSDTRLPLETQHQTLAGAWASLSS